MVEIFKYISLLLIHFKIEIFTVYLPDYFHSIYKIHEIMNLVQKLNVTVYKCNSILN